MNLQKKIKVFKNIISEQKQKELKNLFLEDRIFPWYFIEDVTGVKQNRPAMRHEFCSIDKGVNSQYFNSILPIIHYIKKPELKVLKVNSFLQFPTSFKTYDTPHHDLPNLKKQYTVFMYYLMSSDGDTIFFDKNKKIIKQVTPEQGTAIMFDGSLLHTAYQPKKNIRCVVNFNILGSYKDNLKYVNL